MNLKDLQILIVDDTSIQQKVLMSFLKLIGCRSIVAVNNGYEAVLAVEHENYDIIFMDCTMPVMDGFEATRKIRLLPAPKNSVFISAYTARANQEECFEAGMNNFLAKPVTVQSIESCLLEFCEKCS